MWRSFRHNSTLVPSAPSNPYLPTSNPLISDTYQGILGETFLRPNIYLHLLPPTRYLLHIYLPDDRRHDFSDRKNNV
jgi:hypothetical protein